MAKASKIEWTDSTFNPWIGCTKISPACDHCYASVSTPVRTRGILWGAGQPRVRTKTWMDPIRWNDQPFAECPACGWRGESRESRMEDGRGALFCPECHQPGLVSARRRVFCASLADVFDNQVDPQWRVDLFDLIRRTPNLDWLLLTKRIGNARKMIEAAAEATVGTGALNLGLTLWAFGTSVPGNVWIGATIANQEEADRDIPKLLATPARVRFLSMEPLLGPVDLLRLGAPVGYPDLSWNVLAPGQDRVDWVIVGGESGPGARPMHPDWARDLRDQCDDAGVPFLFKQWGEWLPHDQRTLQAMAAPPLGTADFKNMQCLHRDGRLFYKVGKEAAGRLLDGRAHDGYPRAAA